MKDKIPKLYDIVETNGVASLVAQPLPDTVAPQFLSDLEKRVRIYCTMQDKNVLFEIAAGAAATVVITHGLPKDLGLNQQGYCLKTFERDARTVRDWRYTAEIYEQIGGLEAAVQPNAYSQVLALKAIKEDRRKAAWEFCAQANSGKAPTGSQLKTWARDNHALEGADKSKPATVASEPGIPIETHQEAQKRLRALVSRTAKDKDGDLHTELKLLLKYFEGKVFGASVSKRRSSKFKKPGPGQVELNIGNPVPTSVAA